MEQEEFKQVDKFIVSNKILGQGNFGTVYRGFFKDDLSKMVAVKVIGLQNASKDQRQIKLLKREIEILMKIKNKYIVSLFHATRTPNNLYMFLDYCNEGDLKELLKKKGGRLPESEAVNYFRQICEGFRTLYKESVIHRDIKPANIMIKDGKALISDFGFARCIDKCGMEDQTAKTYLGTPLYMAPQILQEEKFSSKCDIWSLGMLFYEILYGRTPWSANTPYRLLRNIKEIPLQFPEQPKTSDLVKDMLKKMLVFNEDDRISWTDLLDHQLIKLDFDDIQKKINQINQINDTDALLRSVEVNAFYCDKNKVMGIDKHQQLKAFKNPNDISQQQTSGESNTQSQSESEKQVQSNQTNEIDMQVVIKKQQEQLDLVKMVKNIDSYLTFQRNVGIFVNLTTNFIFKLHQDQMFTLPQHLFFRIMFVLQKKQLIGFKHLLDMMSGKTPADNNLFTQDQLKYYQKQEQYRQTLQVIKNDNGFVQPYFSEIFARTTDILSKYNEQEIEEFKQILDQDLSNNNVVFNNIYNKTLDEFLTTVKMQLSAIEGNKRDLLQTSYYVFICKNPYQVFKWTEGDDNSGFHSFYEQFDQMQESELLIKLQEQFQQQQ